MIAENMGNIGFENFIHLALDYTEKDAKKLFYQANIQGISVNTAYQYIVFHQCNEGYNARNERNTFLEAFQQSKLGKIGKIAFLDENDGLILLEAEKDPQQHTLDQRHNNGTIKKNSRDTSD